MNHLSSKVILHLQLQPRPQFGVKQGNTFMHQIIRIKSRPTSRTIHSHLTFSHTLGRAGLSGKGLQSNFSLYWSDIPGKERWHETQSSLPVNVLMTDFLENKLSPCL